MPFEQLYLLFKYGEKDNPWEKLDYKAVKDTAVFWSSGT